MASLPQASAILLARRPVKRPAAELARDVAEALRLLGYSRRGAVELQEQHRRLGQLKLGMKIDRAHLERIKQFDARNGNAGLDGQDGRAAAGLDRGKRTHAAGYRLRNAGELERQFGDDAERALRSD